MALHPPDRGALLVGDALMTEDPAGPRVSGVQLLPDYFNHDEQRAVASLERLRPLEAEVVVPGHGPAFEGTPAAAVAHALSDHRAGPAADGHR